MDGILSILAKTLNPEQDVGGVAPYGLRYGGDTPLGSNPSVKGRGYFGPIQTKAGDSMTEFSSSFTHNGKQIAHPLVVPTLTVDELKLLLGGGDIPNSIYQKAQDYALKRISEGQSPFADQTGFKYPLPSEWPVK